jgi:hypothetical protein
MLYLLLATRFLLSRLTAVTLAVVLFLPKEPQPRVSEGILVLYISPIAPWLEGWFTMILPVFTLSANSFIMLSSLE